MRITIALPLAVLALGAGLSGCSKPPPVRVQQAYVPPTPEPPSLNAPVCVRPPERAAFEMSTLKSHLTVTAIQCHAEERYNAFVMKYRPDLVGGEKVLGTYFARAYGRGARTQQDDYITQLANAQSQFAVRSGSLYCPQNVGIFDEVMTVRTGADLPAFAQSHPIQQAIAVEDCPAGAAPPAKKAVARPAAKRH